MKIALLSINYFPEIIGIGKYNTELIDYLSNKGHDLTIYTAFPYYPEWTVNKRYKNKLFVKEKKGKIEIKRSFIYVPSKTTTFRRILHEISFCISSFINLLFLKEHDMLITVSPPIGLGSVAFFISKLKRIPFIFHIQDLQPDAADELGMIKNETLLKVLYKLESFIYSVSTLISVISDKMKERIIKKGFIADKIYVLPNWTDLEQIKPMPSENDFRKNHGLTGKFVVLYSGNIGYKQGIDIIPKMASMSKEDKNIVYIISGEGNYRSELVKIVEDMCLDNIFFLPVQDNDIFPLMLAAADVCLVPQKISVTDFVMPSKLLGILAASKPVIAGAKQNSELYNVIAKANCGIIVEPEDEGRFYDAMMKLYNNSTLAGQYGINGREYAKNYFEKNKILSEFEIFLRNLINEHKYRKKGG